MGQKCPHGPTMTKKHIIELDSNFVCNLSCNSALNFSAPLAFQLCLPSDQVTPLSSWNQLRATVSGTSVLTPLSHFSEKLFYLLEVQALLLHQETVSGTSGLLTPCHTSERSSKDWQSYFVSLKYSLRILIQSADNIEQIL